MTASAIQPAQTLPVIPMHDFSAEQIDLIKQTVAAGTSDLELALFLEVAKSSGLNPFQRQIYAVMRWDAKTRKEKMVIQTGIDGYRLTAARSGVHMGTTDPEFGPIPKRASRSSPTSSCASWCMDRSQSFRPRPAGASTSRPAKKARPPCGSGCPTPCWANVPRRSPCARRSPPS